LSTGRQQGLSRDAPKSAPTRDKNRHGARLLKSKRLTWEVSLVRIRADTRLFRIRDSRPFAVNRQSAELWDLP
jgi:hypothetical protein